MPRGFALLADRFDASADWLMGVLVPPQPRSPWVRTRTCLAYAALVVILSIIPVSWVFRVAPFLSCEEWLSHAVLYIVFVSILAASLSPGRCSATACIWA